jgi:hypothetical protein
MWRKGSATRVYDRNGDDVSGRGSMGGRIPRTPFAIIPINDAPSRATPGDTSRRGPLTPTRATRRRSLLASRHSVVNAASSRPPSRRLGRCDRRDFALFISPGARESVPPARAEDGGMTESAAVSGRARASAVLAEAVVPCQLSLASKCDAGSSRVCCPMASLRCPATNGKSRADELKATVLARD